jgi:uncharacterized protein (DUF1015 family)
MKIYPFKAIYPHSKKIASSDSFFSSVRDDYNKYYDKGYFEKADEKAYYILEIKQGNKVHSGLVATLDVTDYSKGRIVRHEQTIESSEQEMLKILLSRGAMVKPVLLCHPEQKEIVRELQKLKRKKDRLKTISASSGKNEYILYQIPEEEGADLAKLYDTLVPKVYIADGHHRCSTGEKLLATYGDDKHRDYSLLLTALFSFDQLDILDYNRIVQLPESLSLPKFIAQLSELADIQALSRAAKPERKHDVTLCINREWFLLTWKKETLEKYNHLPAILDADVLNKEILEKLLDIEDVRSDDRVEYISGDLGSEKVEEKTMQSDHHAGFCIFPVSFDELVTISDSGGTLPPKSTWFEPRMINGFVVKAY